MKALADEVSLAGIQVRHPAADVRELRVRLSVLKYAPDLMRKVFG